MAISVKRRRWSIRIASLLAAMGIAAITAFVFREPLLTDLARAWVVDQPASQADAIVILGGNIEDRPFAAANLFHHQVAPVILYMDVSGDPVSQLGVNPSERELTRRILLSNNVPESALQAIGRQVDSTYDESRAVRTWARQTGATSIVIITDLFHTRRARWIFRHELRDTPVKVYVVPVNPRQYDINNWWKKEDGVIAFQNEIIKSIYYWIEY